VPSVGFHTGLEPFGSLVNCFIDDWLMHPSPDLSASVATLKLVPDC